MTTVTVEEETIDVTVVEDVITLNVYGGASPNSVANVASDLSDHEGDTENPHNVTAAQVGADESGSAATVASDLSDHEALSTTAHGGIVADDDSRLADARTPTAHAASHATGQSDAIVPEDIGAEPGLGNPSTDDYILSSTIAGVRTWIEMAAGGGGDVEEAPEDGTPYSRQDGGWVSALRTSIANTWTAIQTFSAGIVTGIIKPAADATDAIQIQDAGGDPLITVDTVYGIYQFRNGYQADTTMELYTINADGRMGIRVNDKNDVDRSILQSIYSVLSVGPSTKVAPGYGLTGNIGFNGDRTTFGYGVFGQGSFGVGTHKSLFIGTPEMGDTNSGFGGTADTVDIATFAMTGNAWSGVRPGIRYSAESHEFRTDESAGQLNPGTTVILIDDGNVYMPNLPTADPVSTGALWNDAGTVKISAGS